MSRSTDPDDIIQSAAAAVVDAEGEWVGLHIDGQVAPSPALRAIVELACCCEGAAMNGPARCTCWVPVYDLEQTDPDTTTLAGARTEPCSDCAYRPDSPERNGSAEHALSGAGELDALVVSGQPFWCHVGMRKPIAYEHPSGIRVTARADHYDPPIIAGVPYRADGTAGQLCAGWLARRLHVMQTDVEEVAGG